jgi:hypothetical protein
MLERVFSVEPRQLDGSDRLPFAADPRGVDDRHISHAMRAVGGNRGCALRDLAYGGAVAPNVKRRKLRRGSRNCWAASRELGEHFG